MKKKNTPEIKLSDEDIERIVDELFRSKQFEDLFNQRWKCLNDICQMRIAKQIGFAVEDQAKLQAISEIMMANYRAKLHKIEENE